MTVRLCKIQELTSQTVNERFCKVQAFSKNSAALDFVRFRYCALLYTSCQNLKKLGVSVLTWIGFVTLRVFRLSQFFVFLWCECKCMLVSFFIFLMCVSSVCQFHVCTCIGYVTLRVFRLGFYLLFFFFLVCMLVLALFVCQCLLVSRGSFFYFFGVYIKCLLIPCPHLDGICCTDCVKTFWSRLVYTSSIFLFFGCVCQFLLISCPHLGKVCYTEGFRLRFIFLFLFCWCVCQQFHFFGEDVCTSEFLCFCCCLLVYLLNTHCQNLKDL